jgi:hypothetical protein
VTSPSSGTATRLNFYFLFGNYNGPLEEQGIAIARMRYEDREQPVGKVVKYFQGSWSEPGLGGRVSALLPALVDWQKAETDSCWGPSIHWNSHLEKSVVLMNRSCCEPGWPQSGIWMFFLGFLADPSTRSEPQEILRDLPFRPARYPQVIGLGEGETDTTAGQNARLWIRGVSSWQLKFSR